MQKKTMILAVLIISLLSISVFVSACNNKNNKVDKLLAKILDKKHKAFDKYLTTHTDFLIAHPDICLINADCKVNICGGNSCMNHNWYPGIGQDEPIGCAFPPWDRADSCSCINHKCVGSQGPWPSCGDGVCDAGDWDRCPEDCATA